MLPDKSIKCHRTAFEKTCFQCVTEHGCRLWKRVTLEFHPETGASGVDHYDCFDSLQDLYMKDLLRRQLQTTATVDNLRKEVQESNDAGMASVILGLNGQMQRIAEQRPQSIGPPSDAPKLLEN